MGSIQRGRTTLVASSAAESRPAKNSRTTGEGSRRGRVSHPPALEAWMTDHHRQYSPGPDRQGTSNAIQAAAGRNLYIHTQAVTPYHRRSSHDEFIQQATSKPFARILWISVGKLSSSGPSYRFILIRPPFDQKTGGIRS